MGVVLFSLYFCSVSYFRDFSSIFVGIGSFMDCCSHSLERGYGYTRRRWYPAYSVNLYRDTNRACVIREKNVSVSKHRSIFWVTTMVAHCGHGKRDDKVGEMMDINPSVNRNVYFLTSGSSQEVDKKDMNRVGRVFSIPGKLEFW